MNTKKIYLGLGSNVGNRLNYLCEAVTELAHLPKTVLTAVSSIYETEPVGNVPQNQFLNCVVEVESSEEIVLFHAHTKEIEQRIGRTKSVQWGPREIDIDLLLCGDEIITNGILNIPHAEISRRKFVLVPFCEIGGEAVHPIFKKTINEIFAECPDRHDVKKSEADTEQFKTQLKEFFVRTTC